MFVWTWTLISISLAYISHGVMARNCITAGCLGTNYTGTVSVTRNGATCQAWTSQSPHTHSNYTTDDNFTNDDGIVNAMNYCRNPNSSALGGPWCYTTDPTHRWEYCDVPLCKNCIDVGLRGKDYTGSVSVTKSAKLCIAWAALQTGYTDGNFASDGGIVNAQNYCRNPDNSHGVWCYTDVNGSLEYCNIPYCRHSCIEVGSDGSGYTGTVNMTPSGRTCQAWNSDFPHPQAPTDFILDITSTNAINYCRTLLDAAGPWCHTMDPNVSWEYCTVPYCRHDCIEVGSNGVEYTGSVNVTMSGLTCQAWASQSPHAHSQTNFVSDGNITNAVNYCRNPDDSACAPWCYTTNSNVSWDYCFVPYCRHDNCLLTTMGTEYTGYVNVTSSGLICQAWASQSTYSDIYFATDGGKANAKNYCRNPDKNKTPWCYTTDPNNPWEYCNIPMCTATTNPKSS